MSDEIVLHQAVSAPPLGMPLGATRRALRGNHGHRSHEPLPSESRGLATSMRRDAIFRRMLLAADILAIAGAFALTVELSSRSLQLTWASVAALPILLVGAKILGLADRTVAVCRLF